METVRGRSNGNETLVISMRKKIPWGITIAVAAAIGISVGHWAADRDPPATATTEVLTPVVKAGDNLRLKVSIFRHRYCQTGIDTYLYDGQQNRIMLGQQTVSAAPGPLGQNDPYNIEVHIPASFKPGAARRVTVATYACNPLEQLWPIIVQTEVRFTVVN